MSKPVEDVLHFANKKVTVDANGYYDLIFYAPYDWCRFLLEHEGWRYLDEACVGFHPDHVDMLAYWAGKEAEQLPEEIRHPQDGTVHDLPTLIRYLSAALAWKVANRKLDEAFIAHSEAAPTIASEDAVRTAAKELINAALDYPPPYRDGMVQRSLVWTDFMDRAWLQGLNIPTPWGTARNSK